MTTRSRSPTNSVPGQRKRIADVIYRSLKTALKTEYSRRYVGDVTLRRLDRSSPSELMRLRLKCCNEDPLRVRVTASHVGGNVFDIKCGMKKEEGRSRRFSYSFGGESATTLSQVPSLGRKLSTFLLNELERRLGRRRIRENEQTVTDANFTDAN